MDRLRRTIERDKNHASIIGFSMGNEAGYGANFEAAKEWAKSHHPEFFIIYEPGNSIHGDALTPMYAKPQNIVGYYNQYGQRAPILRDRIRARHGQQHRQLPAILGSIRIAALGARRLYLGLG